MDVEVSLTTADYLVAVVMLLCPVGIGVWYAVKDAKRATRDEYLLGGRQMSVLPVALSILMTFMSGVSQMGLPVESYYYSGIIVWAGCGLSLSFIIVGYTVVPLMYPLRLTSVYEYLKLRYKSEAVRLFSTVVGLITTIMAMAVALLSPALALEATVKLPLWMSVALFGSVGTLYTAIGGFKGVVWSDVFQTVVITIGIFIIIIKGCIEAGGLGEIFRLSKEGGRLDFNRFTPDLTFRHSIWGVTIGHCSLWVIHGYNQASLQRISSMKSQRGATLAYWTLIPMVLVYVTVFCLLGFVMFAYFSIRECDPFHAGFISNRNQIAPYFVLHVMRDMQGMAGLYIAVLCCGSLSSLSSGLNALAANTVEDILRRPLQKLRESTTISITKILAVAYGGLIIGLTYLISSLEGSILQLGVTANSALGAPILGIFVMGASVPWANKYGAVAGIFASVMFNLWMGVGNRIHGLPPKTLPSIGVKGCSKLIGTLSNVTGVIQDNVFNCDSVLPSCNTNATTGIPEVSKSSLETDESDIFLLYRISYEWYTLLGFTVCVTVGLTVSFIVHRLYLMGGEEHTKVEARYIFPFLRRFWGMENTQDSCTVASNKDTNSGIKPNSFEEDGMVQLKERKGL